MSDSIQPTLDIDEVLEGFSAKNAEVTQRLVLAEAGIKARDRMIDHLGKQVADMTMERDALIVERDVLAGSGKGDSDPEWVAAQDAEAEPKRVSKRR